jgi:hypothetical protein
MITRGNILFGLAIVAAVSSSTSFARSHADPQASVSAGIEVSAPTDSSAARRQRKARRTAVRSYPGPIVAPSSSSYPGYGYGIGDNSSCAC